MCVIYITILVLVHVVIFLKYNEMSYILFRRFISGLSTASCLAHRRRILMRQSAAAPYQVSVCVIVCVCVCMCVAEVKVRYLVI